jgi:hypothetical protein
LLIADLADSSELRADGSDSLYLERSQGRRHRRIQALDSTSQWDCGGDLAPVLYQPREPAPLFPNDNGNRFGQELQPKKGLVGESIKADRPNSQPLQTRQRIGH